MSLDRILEFSVDHSGEIIAFCIVAFLIFFAIHLFLGLKEEKGTEASANDLKSLEETLRRVIESVPKPSANGTQVSGTAASTSNEGAGIPAGDVVPSAELQKKDAELQALKKELEKTRQEVAIAKSNAQASNANDDLQKKIDELEARLHEYEIIEDDIANLSLYKEENKKLKDQLDGLGATPTEVEQKPKAVAPSDEDMANEVAAEAIAEERVSEPDEDEESSEPSLDSEVAEAVAAVEAQSGDVQKAAPTEGGDILSEFAAALGEEVEPTQASAPATPQEKKEADEAANVLEGFDTDKMIAEAAELEGQAADGDGENIGLGDVDPDKMIAEAAELGGETPEDTPVEAQAPAVETQAPLKEEKSALEEVDTEKMVQEASELKKAPPPASDSEDDDQDPGLKLISEFEQFVSGGDKGKEG